MIGPSGLDANCGRNTDGKVFECALALRGALPASAGSASSAGRCPAVRSVCTRSCRKRSGALGWPFALPPCRRFFARHPRLMIGACGTSRAVGSNWNLRYQTAYVRWLESEWSALCLPTCRRHSFRLSGPMRTKYWVPLSPKPKLCSLRKARPQSRCLN